MVGLRSQVADGTQINRTVLMGADYYIPKDGFQEGDIPIGIGPNCQIEGAIIDKNARIGEGVVIQPFPPGTEFEEGNWVVQDGIVVIPKSTTLYPGTYIGPD